MMKLYLTMLDKGKRKRYAWGYLVGDYPTKEMFCAQCNKKWLDRTNIYEDVLIKMVLDREYFADFTSDNGSSSDLISPRAIEVFEKEKVTGYFLKDNVKILSQSELDETMKKQLRLDGLRIKNIAEHPPRYLRLFVEYGASVHPKSGLTIIGECESCGRLITEGKSDPQSETLYIRKSSWNGNDLFRVKGHNQLMFCSERFKEIYYESKLTGLHFDYKKVEVLDD